MKGGRAITRRPLSRRHFLRDAGVALALPWLEAMLPQFARGQAGAVDGGAKPQRLFAVMNNLGFIPKNFFPPTEGWNYVPSPYLTLLPEYRKEFTVFSNVSLPGVAGPSLVTEQCWLTGAPNPGAGSFRNTISLDQVVARHFGERTRFPSLPLAINGRLGLSYTETGERVPPEQSVTEVYRRLFVQGTPAEIEQQREKLRTGQSILDTLKAQAAELAQATGKEDREQLDQYFTSIRTLERQMQAAEMWEENAKPAISEAAPSDPAPSQYFEKIAIMYGLAVLAFQTDSTRAITLLISSAGTPVVEGRFGVEIKEPYHALARHKGSAPRLAQLQALDREHFKWLNTLLGGLKAAQEGDETLLDRTQVLWGSNWNDYNTKQTTNLPIVLAGGGWKHGQHLAFVPDHNRPASSYVHGAQAGFNTGDYPLTNLHLSMLHRMGIPVDRFATSTGEMAGLEIR